MTYGTAITRLDDTVGRIKMEDELYIEKLFIKVAYRL